MQINKDDQVWIKDLKQYGTVESVDGEKVKVKLTTGQSIEVLSIVIEVLDKLPSIFHWVKNVWQRLRKVFKK
jgi:hypothetical protein